MSEDLLDPASDHPLDLLGRAARELLPPSAWGYLMGAAGAGEAALRNEIELRRLTLLPRICRDVSDIDTATTLFGHTYAHPVVVAPSAMHHLFHPGGERETARGADAARAPLTVSMEASTPWAEVEADEMWCQISPQRDGAVTVDLLRRARDVGARAVVLTLDTPVSGARHGQLRAMPELPSWIERPNLPATTDAHLAASYTHSGFTWREIEQLAAASPLPLIGKGVLHPDDASRGVDAGLSAIAVSNHGGRNLDAAPAPIAQLAAVVAAVDGRVPVLVDGGFRRGSDVLKALALGATAVMVGRPVLWGLAVRGADGVREVLDTFVSELRAAMALCGVRSIGELDPSLVQG